MNRLFCIFVLSALSTSSFSYSHEILLEGLSGFRIGYDLGFHQLDVSAFFSGHNSEQQSRHTNSTYDSKSGEYSFGSYLFLGKNLIQNKNVRLIPAIGVSYGFSKYYYSWGYETKTKSITSIFKLSVSKLFGNFILGACTDLFSYTWQFEDYGYGSSPREREGYKIQFDYSPNLILGYSF